MGGDCLQTRPQGRLAGLSPGPELRRECRGDPHGDAALSTSTPLGEGRPQWFWPQGPPCSLGLAWPPTYPGVQTGEQWGLETPTGPHGRCPPGPTPPPPFRPAPTAPVPPTLTPLSCQQPQRLCVVGGGVSPWTSSGWRADRSAHGADARTHLLATTTTFPQPSLWGQKLGTRAIVAQASARPGSLRSRLCIWELRVPGTEPVHPPVRTTGGHDTT